MFRFVCYSNSCLFFGQRNKLSVGVQSTKFWEQAPCTYITFVNSNLNFYDLLLLTFTKHILCSF